MIIEKQTENIVLSDGDEAIDSISTQLDLESADFLMTMLSEGIYSDAIGSTVRETASNALDSHRKANVTEPIIVSFGINSTSKNYEYSVEDFGVGLDDVDVKEIISKYGKSTSRSVVSALGAFGLGFKSPLSYSSSFTFIARKNGTERVYIMYKGEERTMIDLLSETSTSERNGVKVIVPVQYSDSVDFINSIKEQLAYFENVYFNVSGIDNSFKIKRAELFQMSELCDSGELHMCLDNVYYPIDFDKLGIKRIKTPVALRFSLTDGITPLPNRESIKYTIDAKSLIMKKIKDFADYCINEYNRNFKDSDGDNHEKLLNLFKFFESSSKYINIEPDTSLLIDDIIEYSSIPILTPVLSGLSILSSKEVYSMRYNFLSNHHIFMERTHGKLQLRNKETSINSRYYSDVKYNVRRPYYLQNEGFFMSAMLKSYFRERISTHVYFVKKNSYERRLIKRDRWGDLIDDCYYRILRLGSHPKSEWRQRIIDFQYIESIILSSFINLKDIIIPQEFIDSKKKQSFSSGTNASSGRRIKLEGEISAKIGNRLEKETGNYCKFSPVVLQMANFHRKKEVYVYGKEEDKTTLDKFYGMFINMPVRFITVSDREYNKLSKISIHNLIPLKKFMEGEFAPFKRIVTAYLIRKLKAKYKFAFSNVHGIETISKSLFDKINTLDSYSREHFNYNTYEENLYKAMLEVSAAKNLFDYPMYSTYLEVEAILTKYYFINTILSKIANYHKDDDESILQVMRDMFRFYKYKMDVGNYPKVELNEESEQLTEETIEELQTV